jgi:hypothetical protein
MQIKLAQEVLSIYVVPIEGSFQVRLEDAQDRPPELALGVEQNNAVLTGRQPGESRVGYGPLAPDSVRPLKYILVLEYNLEGC